MRDYTKWDDQPGSALAAREAILRADWIANTSPKGPVCVNLDAGLQEAGLTVVPAPINATRFRPAVKAGADAAEIATIATLLRGARTPVILAGRAVIERMWARLKNCRRIATRYDCFARNYLASLTLVSIMLAWT